VHIVDNFPVKIMLHRGDEFLPAPSFFGTFDASHIYMWNPVLPPSKKKTQSAAKHSKSPESTRKRDIRISNILSFYLFLAIVALNVFVRLYGSTGSEVLLPLPKGFFLFGYT
jgi:hypothetical protein